MLYEIGILFSLDSLDGYNYRDQAWQIFMKTCDPTRLSGSTLYEGETNDPLTHSENVYCIAVQASEPSVVEYLKKTFLRSTAPGLMPLEQRFLEKGITLRYALSIRAQIDQNGLFHSWQEAYVRQDQRLCAAAGWEFGGIVKSSYTLA